MKKLKALLLTVFIVLMLFASCDNGIRTLGEENIKMLSSVTEDAFAQFDTLSSGSKELKSNGYTGTATLSVENGKWSMHITGEDAEGSVIDYTITQDDVESDSTVRVKIGDVTYDASASALFSGSELPKNPLTDAELAIFKEAVNAAFGSMDYLETKNDGNFTLSDGTEGTFSITVAGTSWTLTVNSAIGDSQYTLIVTDTAATLSYNNAQYSLDRSDIMTGDVKVPDLPPTELEEDVITLLSSTLKEAFSKFDYLQTGKQSFDYEGYSVTANLSVTDVDTRAWTMHIEATGDPAFSFTITNSDTDVDVTYKGEGPFKTSYASLMEGVDEYIPDRKPTALTDDQYGILNGSLIAAFGNFEKLETKDNVAFSYEGFTGTASLEVDTDFSWTITLSGSNSNSEAFSFTLTSADKSINVTFNDLPLPAEVDRLMANVKVPPIGMTDDDYATSVADFKSFGQDRVLNDIMYLIERGEGFKPERDGVITRTAMSYADGKITINATAENYAYCGSSKPQRISGDVEIVLLGTESEGTFSASGYSVSSTSVLSIGSNQYEVRNIAGQFAKDKFTGFNSLEATTIPITITDGTPTDMTYSNGDAAFWLPESGEIVLNEHEGDIAGFTAYVMNNPGSIL